MRLVLFKAIRLQNAVLHVLSNVISINTIFDSYRCCRNIIVKCQSPQLSSIQTEAECPSYLVMT